MSRVKCDVYTSTAAFVCVCAHASPTPGPIFAAPFLPLASSVRCLWVRMVTAVRMCNMSARRPCPVPCVRLVSSVRVLSVGMIRRVTVVEKNGEGQMGGRLNELEMEGGFRFDTGPSLLLLPETYRETFRGAVHNSIASC